MKVNILGKNCCEIETSTGTYLQSYKTIVAWKRGATVILYPKWDYSRTTAAHVSHWLRTTAKEIRRKIETLEYIYCEEGPEL